VYIFMYCKKISGKIPEDGVGLDNYFNYVVKVILFCDCAIPG
jgi:hypothetical protein